MVQDEMLDVRIIVPIFCPKQRQHRRRLFLPKRNGLVRHERVTDTAQLSTNACQEKGCFPGSAKEADSVHHDSQKRKTAHGSRFPQLSGSAIDTLPDEIGVEFCVVYRVCGSNVP